jgi:Universal stress protein family
MNRIVICVDGAPSATAAARRAACEAAMRNVDLTVVNVLQSAPQVWPPTAWSPIPPPAEAGEGQFARDEAILEDTLSVIAKTIGAQRLGSISSKVCVGAVVNRLRQPTSRSPMTRHAGFSSVVGLAELRKGSTELAPPPHSC